MRREVEHGLQVAVARFLDLCLDPERTWWSAIDHGAGKMSKRSAGMMKARGVKRGLPDIILMWKTPDTHSHLIGIELKANTGKVSSAQEDVCMAWMTFSNVVYLAFSLEDVHAILVQCGVPLRRHMTFFREGVGNRTTIRMKKAQGGKR
jgi:hypothetical protein